MKYKVSFGERIFETVIYAALVIFSFSCVYPLYNSLVISLNDGVDAANGGIYFWPRLFTLDNYIRVLADGQVARAFAVTALRTVLGACSSILVTSILAYALSKKKLIGGGIYMRMCIFTMYFGGGLIPFFLLIRSLHLIDNFFVYIIPGLVGVYNMIIFKSFFEQQPEALEESARIDGANHLIIFFRIIMPISKPVYAALGLFSAVYHWNEFFSATIFMNNNKLWPLQTVLNQKINATTAIQELADKSNAAEMVNQLRGITTQSVVVTTMIVVTLPIILVYPFLQKYFVKGVMLGSVKE